MFHLPIHGGGGEDADDGAGSHGDVSGGAEEDVEENWPDGGEQSILHLHGGQRAEGQGLRDVQDAHRQPREQVCHGVLL